MYEEILFDLLNRQCLLSIELQQQQQKKPSTNQNKHWTKNVFSGVIWVLVLPVLISMELFVSTKLSYILTCAQNFVER